MTEKKAEKPMPLPCPWCGELPAIWQAGGGWIMGCELEDCPARPRVIAVKEAAAIAAWNRRAK